MNRTVLTAGAVAIVVVIVLALSSLFTVDQTEQAIVLQFGAFKRQVRDPGLHVKLPFVQNVIYYDRRVLDTDPPTEEVIAADQKRLVVDSYARFRIVDPLQFYQSMGTEQAARGRLNATISGSLRRVLGNITLGSVLSDERGKIMRQITEEVATQAKPFGIDVIDVRLRRADLPEENSQAIFARMQSERQREAQEFRAQGDEFAQRIRSVAERERTVIIAEAQKQSQILRGQGEGESVKIYADAFGKDKNFFAFYRSMQAYREALGGQNTTLVLSPDSDFFRFFGSSSGKGGQAEAPVAAPTASDGNAKP
jgi:modulator of FtsH protease HflC